MTDSDNLFAPVPDPPPVIEHTQPAPVARRGGTPLLLTLVLFIALGGGLYVVWTHPQPNEAASGQAPATDPAQAIESLKSEFAGKTNALSDRLDRLEKQPAPSPAPAEAAAPDAAAPDATAEAPDADLAKKLADLSARLDALTARQDQQAQALQKASELAAQKPADILAPPPPPDHGAQDAAAAQTQQQLADLGGKLDQSFAQQKASVDSLAQRLGQLEQKSSQPAPPPQDAVAIDTLGARVAKLEQGEGQIAGARQDAALAVRLESAQAALQAGQPLGDLPGAAPALTRFATTPPPTEAALRATFPQMQAATLAASRPETSQTGFFNRAMARMEQSVTVRQGDHVIVGDPASGVLARAQTDVNAGDLAGAVAALKALDGPSAAAARDWVAQAQSLLDARAALAALAHR